MVRANVLAGMIASLGFLAAAAGCSGDDASTGSGPLLAQIDPPGADGGTRDGGHCVLDSECEVACDYANRCIPAPSCKPHLGGDTCGTGEVGDTEGSARSDLNVKPVKGESVLRVQRPEAKAAYTGGRCMRFK